MKLTHIFWSLAIVAAAIFGFRALWHTSGSLNQGLSIYAFILLLLGLATTASPVVILLIALRKLNPHDSPGVTFLFIVNSFWGLLLAFELWSGEIQYSITTAIVLAILNLLWAAIFLVYVGRKQKRGSDNYAE